MVPLQIYTKRERTFFAYFKKLYQEFVYSYLIAEKLLILIITSPMCILFTIILLV